MLPLGLCLFRAHDKTEQRFASTDCCAPEHELSEIIARDLNARSARGMMCSDTPMRLATIGSSAVSQYRQFRVARVAEKNQRWTFDPCAGNFLWTNERSLDLIE